MLLLTWKKTMYLKQQAAKVNICINVSRSTLVNQALRSQWFSNCTICTFTDLRRQQFPAFTQKKSLNCQYS